MDTKMTNACAECGKEGGATLKVCKACMLVRYCNADCQRNHWKKHKKLCKRRAAELHNEALFKDPPAKEDCAICFLPMPVKLISCISLPPATISSVPIRGFVEANKEFTKIVTEVYYPCCGKSICRGCAHSFCKSGNGDNCPFCKADRVNKTDGERFEEIMKRVEANGAASIYLLGSHYYHGKLGLLQDQGKAIELWKQAAALGSSKAHFELGIIYREGGNSKKEKFHYEAAAMAGHELSRNYLGCMDHDAGSMERALKHWTIAASAGNYLAMDNLIFAFNHGSVSRNAIDSTITAYNNSCVEMRSEARDAAIGEFIASIGAR